MDCKCLAGFTGTSDGAACTACEAGGYKATAGTGSCAVCPSHSNSSAGSNEVTDCNCVAGYTVDTGGEALHCEGTCGCVSSLATGGVLSDGTGDYSPHENCSWTISGASPSVSFTSFLIDSGWDYVYVDQCWDAECSSGVENLAKLSGTPELATYTATGQHLRVRFTSDFMGQDSGFTASWVSDSGTWFSCTNIDECTGWPPDTTAVHVVTLRGWWTDLLGTYRFPGSL